MEGILCCISANYPILKNPLSICYWEFFTGCVLLVDHLNYPFTMVLSPLFPLLPPSSFWCLPFAELLKTRFLPFSLVSLTLFSSIPLTFLWDSVFISKDLLTFLVKGSVTTLLPFSRPKCWMVFSSSFHYSHVKLAEAKTIFLDII